MEVQAIVVHEPPNEGMKWEAQSAEEVGKKNDPLMEPRGGDELPLIWKPVGDFFHQIPGLPKLGDVLLPNGGGHPFALPSGSGHGRKRSRRDARAWALELECAEMDKQSRKKA